jgi:hypothetical protein
MMIFKGRLTAVFLAAVGVALCTPTLFVTAQSAPRPLDYEFFKTQVEPIFLKNRSNHARCYVCHQRSRHNEFKGVGLFLEQLSPGKDFWDEEQSRKNFETISKVVVPGNPLKSPFPMHPLAPEAGGDEHVHGGGRQFESQNDPDFQTIAAWIRGEKANASSGQ